MKKRQCRHCKQMLRAGEGEAFCPQNPHAERNRAAWRAGRKFNIGPPVEAVKVACVVVPTSPFQPAAQFERGQGAKR